ncbi:MAG: CYTH domain-containing protein [Muribaculaceae bacterium]|nr:CYTH domain-containing protein [Muribaculaceae bacterium]
MALEIERKFLVLNDSYKSMASRSVRICQGYLNRDRERTVRVRIMGDKSYLTIKGVTKGSVREEFEYEIPLCDGMALMRMCGDDILDKCRWYVEYEGKCWEVDEFGGKLSGLVVAEIELESDGEEISFPVFIGREVTDDPRYYNSMLIDASSAPLI